MMNHMASDFPENARWRCRAAAVNLRLSLIGKPMTPGAQLMLDALDAATDGRRPLPEPTAEVDGVEHLENPMPPELEYRVQLALMTGMAMGFTCAGLGFGTLVTCTAMGMLP
jgi:hypothetical protein